MNRSKKRIPSTVIACLLTLAALVVLCFLLPVDLQAEIERATGEASGVGALGVGIGMGIVGAILVLMAMGSALVSAVAGVFAFIGRRSVLRSVRIINTVALSLAALTVIGDAVKLIQFLA